MSPAAAPPIRLRISPLSTPTPRPEPLGRRIADRRAALGMTQQDLAERVAISRVALSNLESARSVPGERTVALLAGVFDLEPHELVIGTDYPLAKIERLPAVTARHTEAALLEALCHRDLRWLEGAPHAVARRVLERWRVDLGRGHRTDRRPSRAGSIGADARGGAALGPRLSPGLEHATRTRMSANRSASVVAMGTSGLQPVAAVRRLESPNSTGMSTGRCSAGSATSS